MKILPEACYEKTNMEGIEIIPFETAVVGTVVKFDVERREIIVDLGKPWIGIIPEEEATIYNLSYSEDRTIPSQITFLFGTQVRAIVTEVNGNVLKLSRKMSMMQAWEALTENTVVTAYIRSNIGYGFFLDIGNGIISYNRRKDITAVKITDTKLWFNEGEIVKERILNKDETNNYKVMSSLRSAYPSLQHVNIRRGDVITVQIGCEKVSGGYFCQYDCNVPGIIDTEAELSEGQHVEALVKKVTIKGLKLTHLE